MKTSRLLLPGALLLLFSLPLAAQVNDTYVITAVANQGGANGTRWQTTFSLFNPQLDHKLRVSVVYLPTGGKTGLEEFVDVPPNSLAYSDNILKDLFDLDNAGGSLLVAAFAEDNPGVPNNALDRSFLVTTNTYNNARTGTFGTTVPGIWTGMLDDGISAVAQNIRNASGWRTNIGAVNLGRCNVTLVVNVYDVDGNTILKQAPFVVPPLGHFQDRLPVTTEAGTVEFFLSDPCKNSNTDYAVVFPYTSTIDPLSGDPQYQSPSLLASASALFAKAQSQPVSAMLKDPTTIGKKIDSAYARGVRGTAQFLGIAQLTREAKGFRITR